MRNISIKQIAVIAAFLFVLVSNTFAQTYTVTGTLEGTYYSWTGRQFADQITQFTVSIEGDHWLLKSEYADKGFWLVGGDGINTYEAFVDPKAPNLPVPAFVFVGDYPQNAYDIVSIPWLAFCSSHFLNHSAERDAIPSVWSQAQIDPMAHICSTEVARFTEMPYLPKEIKWTTSSNQIASASSNIFLRVEGASPQELDKRSIDYAANVQAGALLGNYHALDMTNVNGLILPLKFKLEAYNYFFLTARDRVRSYLNEASKTNALLKNKIDADTWLAALYKGTITGISIDNSHVALPEPNLPMSITDYRLSSKALRIEYVSYQSKEWKPQVDAELLNLLEIKKKQSPHSLMPADPIGPRSRNAMRVIILLIFFTPLFVWGVMKFKKTKSTKKGNI